MRKPNAKDVARAAGVSPATVDRVLNSRGGVDVEKERCVFEWARRLGLDRNLKSRPTRLVRIGALIGPDSNPFYKRLSRAFARANQIFLPANIQCSVRFCNYLDASETVGRIARMEETCDAIIIVSPEHPSVSKALSSLARKKPVVAMITDLPETGRLAYIGLDNRVAGRVAGDLMGRLLGREGNEVVLITETNAMLALRERELGFRDVLAERHPDCRAVGVVETSDGKRGGELLREAVEGARRLWASTWYQRAAAPLLPRLLHSAVAHRRL
jgi:LacI family transcriptional regulator